MRAFGYEKRNKESQEPVELREVTLMCSGEDLRRLYSFIEKVLVSRSVDGSIDKGDWHEHFRDRDERWTREESDIILFVTQQGTEDPPR